MKILRDDLAALRIIALLEGMSFLLILFVTMPLKYYFDLGMPNKLVGMVHGLLFVLYIAYVLVVRTQKNWNLKVTFLLLLASVIPFGTFWAENKYFKTKK
jgi:integral membrane protein